MGIFHGGSEHFIHYSEGREDEGTSGSGENIHQQAFYVETGRSQRPEIKTIGWRTASGACSFNEAEVKQAQNIPGCTVAHFSSSLRFIPVLRELVAGN